MNFDVGGVKPFQFLTLGASDLLASAFADDLIGEHVYVIPPGNIRDWAEQDAFTAPRHCGWRWLPASQPAALRGDERLGTSVVNFPPEAPTSQMGKFGVTGVIVLTPRISK
jgi:hypothetical protein